MAAQHGGTVPKLRIDEILPYINEFGKFQILFNAILCLLKIPTGNALMMPYFTHKNPPWRCITGSNSTCKLNGTFSPSSKDYLYRCRILRSDWEYTQGKEYSVVTQVCRQDKVFLFACASLLWLRCKEGGNHERQKFSAVCLFVLVGLILWSITFGKMNTWSRSASFRKNPVHNLERSPHVKKICLKIPNSLFQKTSYAFFKRMMHHSNMLLNPSSQHDYILYSVRCITFPDVWYFWNNRILKDPLPISRENKKGF